MKQWDALRYCLAVARCGSVSAAARELEVSHATVLRRIDQFEKQLGVKLFKRLQSGYVISEAGEPLLHRVADIESELIDLLELVQGRDDAPSGVLRVTQPQNVLLDLYPIYRGFIKRYPDIQLEVETSLRQRHAGRPLQTHPCWTWIPFKWGGRKKDAVCTQRRRRAGPGRCAVERVYVPFSGVRQQDTSRIESAAGDGRIGAGC